MLEQVHAFSVCDDPDYFYDFVQVLLDGIQAGVLSRDIADIHNVSFSLPLESSFWHLLLHPMVTIIKTCIVISR